MTINPPDDYSGDAGGREVTDTREIPRRPNSDSSDTQRQTVSGLDLPHRARDEIEPVADIGGLESGRGPFASGPDTLVESLASDETRPIEQSLPSPHKPDREPPNRPPGNRAYPTKIQLSADAKVVCDLAAWIGAEGDGDSEHSFSSLLLATLSAANPLSAWLRRYAEANGIK